MAGTFPVEKLNVLMSSPFLRPPPSTVESPAPHAVVSEESGSTANRVETMLLSALAAAVRPGGLGGAEPEPGLPQLNKPPEPLTLTVPGTAGHVLVGLAAPEFAQSWIAPGGASVRMLLSISSQVEGAARIDAGEAARAAAMAPLARACANLLQLAIAGNANGGPPTLLQLVGALR